MTTPDTGPERYLPQPRTKRAGRVGLALSGGGFRAALFHLGALRRLNDAGVLPGVDTITSVSGGSIASGVLVRAWPELVRSARGGVFTSFDTLVERPLRAFCAEDGRTGPLLWSGSARCAGCASRPRADRRRACSRTSTRSTSCRASRCST